MKENKIKLCDLAWNFTSYILANYNVVTIFAGVNKKISHATRKSQVTATAAKRKQKSTEKNVNSFCSHAQVRTFLALPSRSSIFHKIFVKQTNKTTKELRSKFF